MAERGRFELPVLFRYSRFPGVRVKPLCHLSNQLNYLYLRKNETFTIWDILIPPCDTVCMKESQTESKSLRQKTPVPNLVRYVPTGILFARMEVKGKLIRRSLKSKCARQISSADLGRDLLVGLRLFFDADLQLGTGLLNNFLAERSTWQTGTEMVSDRICRINRMDFRS